MCMHGLLSIGAPKTGTHLHMNINSNTKPQLARPLERRGSHSRCNRATMIQKNALVERRCPGHTVTTHTHMDRCTEKQKKTKVQQYVNLGTRAADHPYATPTYEMMPDLVQENSICDDHLQRVKRPTRQSV